MNEQEYISSGAIEACILGIASEAEMANYYNMRNNYPAVKAYADAFEQNLEEEHLKKEGLEPEISVFANIKHKIQNSGTTEAPVLPISTPTKTVRKNLWKEYGMAASFALLLGSTIFNFILTNKVKSLQTQVNDLAKNANKNNPSTGGDAQYAFLKDPAITPVAMYGVGIHGICRCSIYWDQNNNKAYFIIHHLFNPGSEKDYQLWAMVNGKPISVGVVHLNDDKSPILLENVPQGATRFCLTLEKKGGDTQPTMEQMYLNGEIST